MSHRIQITESAQDDLERLLDFLGAKDLSAALRARMAIEKGYALLSEMPFASRKADDTHTLLRELVIPFGSAGYVVLFEIENDTTVSVLAVRHQREEDYH